MSPVRTVEDPASGLRVTLVIGARPRQSLRAAERRSNPRPLRGAPPRSSVYRQGLALPPAVARDDEARARRESLGGSGIT